MSYSTSSLPPALLSISVDKIRAGSFWGFILDETEKVHVLHVPDVRGVVFVSVPGACLNCPMCFARRARCLSQCPWRH